VQDIETTTLLVGLVVAVAEAIKWLAKVAVKSRGNNNLKHYPTIGEQSIDYWETKIRDTVKDGLNEALQLRNEELRKMMKEVMGDWLDGRVGGRLNKR
jgi:hypothetical protein